MPTLYGAKTLSMVERTEVGRAIRDYYVRIEEQVARSDAEAATPRPRLRAEVDALRSARPAKTPVENRETEEPSLAWILDRVLDLPGADADLVRLTIRALDRSDGPETFCDLGICLR